VFDADHSLAWSYDELGRVLTATQAVGTVSKTTSYSYSSGLRQSMTTPSGQFISYGYTNGKVTSVSVNGAVVISDVVYEPFGPVRQWTWGNGSLSVRTFDQDGKVTQIDSAGLKTYTYDDAFRITGITDASDASLSWAYGYDDLDRLTSATKAGTMLGYGYDANGNRLTQTGSAASTFTIDSNSNRLMSTAGALNRAYGYDDAGNTTSFTGITFAYNNRGRMKSSTKNGVTTSYTYNALGQLIKKGSSALYCYDDAGHILGIYSGSGALTEEIVWLGDIPLATLRPNISGGVDVYYIHSDHLNTPRLVTDVSASAIRWRWDAEPFGNEAPNGNPTGAGVFAFDLRFAGQIYLAETAQHYNYYRDGYDPATGRYTQSDPIGLAGGLNTYGYVGANPIMGSDPSGLAEWWDQIRGVGPVDANRARNNARDALSGAQASGLPGLHNGPADAFRHCLWSCLMTQSIGVDQTKIVGDTHEEIGRSQGPPDREEQMDRKNNEVGRRCGLEENPKTCAERCMDKHNLGALYGPGGKRRRNRVPGL